MRFDDMLATVLAQPLTTTAARVATWRQVVDLLGQRRAARDDPAGDRAYDLLRVLRDEVPAAIRAEAARALAGHRVPAGLIGLFAEEPPQIMAPLLARARLTDAEWLALLPYFPPVARGLLRNRRDLGTAVVRGLANFGATDFTLGAPDAVAVAEPAAAVAPSDPAFVPAEGEAQIRELMGRIDAFRRPPPAAAEDVAPVPQPPADRFRFETGADGIFRWVERAPRAALIGITLADAAEQLDHGVDGQAAGAYRQRAPFRDARLSVAGAGAAAGEWRISGVPFFDPADGRFTGYRGTARRPRADQTAAPAAADLHGTGLPLDSLRQLVHELRTPINAVVGFAEMIERQLLGPAGSEYRHRAVDIIEQGRRLLATVDDLDLSARIESQRFALDPASVDGALLLGRLHGDYARIARERGVVLALAVSEGLPAIDADPAMLERMFARLLAATIGLAGRGERIAIGLAPGDAGVVLRLTRPALIAGRDERTLLDPGFSPEGEFPDAPVLGLGFALRLVRSLAFAARGRLDIAAAEFVLSVPANAATALSGNRRG